jgi:pimeloyl-ACP methyl ester carboxylesterase
MGQATTNTSAGVTPWRISVGDDVLVDLWDRLARTRWPDAGLGAAWEQGTDRETLRELCAYWRETFNWRANEQAMNRIPQAMCEVDGQPIHLFHAPSPVPEAFPIVLLHGWPSVNTEFAKVIGPLSDPESHGGRREDAFHVVCPSLPGFGWGGPTRRSGWTPHRIAGALVEVMARLGYDRFGAHGGDWGAMVSSQLGLHFPDRVAGIHLNMVIARPPRDAADPMAGVTDAERAALATTRARGRDEMGYQQIQATRPASVSAGLNDSPAGLAGWIVEKYRAWGDTHGDVYSRFTRDELCALFTTYWASGTIGSANRIYAETRRAGPGSSLPMERVTVPMGFSRFPAEGFGPVRAWVEEAYDVRFWVEHDQGGHFPALEVPQLVIDDLRGFFAGLR